MKKILYLIRTEADFERVVCLCLEGKQKYIQSFIFTGDFSPFYDDGIQNRFQKYLFDREGFKVYNFYEKSLVLKIIVKLFSFKQKLSFYSVKKRKYLLLKFFAFKFFEFYLKRNKLKIVREWLLELDPHILLTDQSSDNEEYLQEIFRRVALTQNIRVGTFTHGAAGGLHSEFSEPKFLEYPGCQVFVCNVNETTKNFNNRIILGDVSSSFPYVNFLNSLNDCIFSYLNERRFRIVVFMGGKAMNTSTSGWFLQEDFIIRNGNEKNVAIVVKIHPRETALIDLSLIAQFDNVQIVGNEIDRSRLLKWSNLVVCNDHCSTIFSAMILGKKVISFAGTRIPKYKNSFSPIKYSTACYMEAPFQGRLEDVRNSDPIDSITDKICWGENGPINLAEKLLFSVDK